jgi:hypothetical protein
VTEPRSRYEETPAYSEGRLAYREGQRRNHNPHAAAGDGKATAWWDGWDYEEWANPHEGTTVCPCCGAIHDEEAHECPACCLSRHVVNTGGKSH